MRRQPITTLVVAGLILLAGSILARADDAAGFYRGKVVNLVVGYGVGGGYDAYARLLAPHLAAALEAQVVVQNQPGGGGLLALNRLARAAPDGLTLMLVNGQAAVLAQLLGQEGVAFDLTRLSWLARVASQPRVLLWSARSPFRTLADAIRAEHPIKWGASGKTDSIGDLVAFLSQALALDSRIVIGYKGSKQAALAAMRGEVDGIVVSDSTAKKLAAGGKMIPAAIIGRRRSSLLPDIETVFEQLPALAADNAWWIDYRDRITAIGRPLAAAPEVPADRVRYLRGVLDRLLTDPDIVAEAKSRGRLMSHAPAATVEGLLADTLRSLNDEQRDRVRAVVLEKYYH